MTNSPSFQPANPRSDVLEALHGHYEAIEAGLTRRQTGDYERLVVPNGNGDEGVHRWFRLKEAFSRRLLARVLKDVGLDATRDLRVLDPFAGSGTTAVAAADLVSDGTLKSSYVLGYECNPFLHLVASSKLRALQSPTATFFPMAKRVAASVVAGKVASPPIPPLATFLNADYFERADLDQLLQLREAIHEAGRKGAPPLDVDLALVCLGGCVEPVSSLRRDGRALRYVPDKHRVRPVSEFLRRAEQVDADLPSRRLAVNGRIQLGDGRHFRPNGPRAGTMDLVLFSPPYPNNIDYTEVYKMEAWLLGFIRDSESFSSQRLRTVYSHPSLLRDAEPAPEDVPLHKRALTTTLDPVLAAIPDDHYATARKAMVSGYARDMLLTMESCWTALRPGGHLVYVVGNSLHGSGDDAFVIAADLIIAQLAKAVGFKVDTLEIARNLKRRGTDSSYLRESVVIAHRPQPNRR